MNRFGKALFLVLLLAGALSPIHALFAQEPEQSQETPQLPGIVYAEPVEFLMSELVWDAQQQKAFLQIKLKLADGHKTSALKQLSTDALPYPTDINFEDSKQFELASELQPATPPLRDLEWKEIGGTEWLYHTGLIVWKAEINIAEGVDLDDVVVVGAIRMLAPTEYS